MRVFGSVVVVAFQIAFRAEIHANDVFLFFKNHFLYQHIKTIQKVQTALNFSKKKKKKNLKFAEKQVEQQSQTLPCSSRRGCCSQEKRNEKKNTTMFRSEKSEVDFRFGNGGVR